MSGDSWRHARLIPTFGSRNDKEREKRATSCLLAVMHGVPEFGHALLKELGAPKSLEIETFAEVRFKNGGGKTVIPDGAIVCQRGKTRWTCPADGAGAAGDRRVHLQPPALLDRPRALALCRALDLRLEERVPPGVHGVLGA